MEALHQEHHAKGFTILAISIDVQGREVVAPFVAEYKLTFPIVLDTQNVVGTRLHVRGIPMSYLLDKQGRIAGMELGAKNWHGAKMRQLIDQLLAESPSPLYEKCPEWSLSMASRSHFHRRRPIVFLLAVLDLGLLGVGAFLTLRYSPTVPPDSWTHLFVYEG